MPMVCTTMPWSRAICAAWSGTMALPVSLPSVSRISTFSCSLASCSSLMVRPMASPRAVFGPAMPMPTSSSSSDRLA
ncbi:hypothetical protein D3C76_1296880 [compost metagenome]